MSEGAWPAGGTPKAELHLHLEGAIRPATVLDLARQNEVDFPFPDPPSLQAALAYQDFPRFLEIFGRVTACLMKPADYERIARELALDLAAQGVIYAEIRYAAMFATRRGLRFDDVTAAILEGTRQAQAEQPHIRLALICGLTRQFGPDACLECARQVAAWAGRGIDAIDLGGDEAAWPANLFVEAYRTANAAGLPGTVHAGEASGPASIRAALELPGARRIGHGIRCLEDAALVDALREREITLEVCPTSNVKTGIVATYEQHPLPLLYEAGLRVTINSDDPALFGTSLSDEYERAARTFRLRPTDLRKMTRTAIEAGFCPDSMKRELLEELE